MHRVDVDFRALLADPRMPLAGGDMLLTAGDFASGSFNAMTVAWGGFGLMWNRPIAIAVVRPTRHTFGFMERFPSYTLCAFPAGHEKALALLGTVSGRDRNKIAEAGLTPVASDCVGAPSYAESDLVVECRTVYWDDISPERFLDPTLRRHYQEEDYHRAYWGEIVSIRAGGTA
jgi:flavin reductase (DIM6/NTAB) family NADH-FMN oxidoreductase RutF